MHSHINVCSLTLCSLSPVGVDAYAHHNIHSCTDSAPTTGANYILSVCTCVTDISVLCQTDCLTKTWKRADTDAILCLLTLPSLPALIYPLSRIRLCVKQVLLFLLFAVADIHRNTCINERSGGKNEECSVCCL